MCESDADYTTIVGPGPAVREFSESWQNLHLPVSKKTLGDMHVSVDLPSQEFESEFPREQVAALAVAWHEPGDGPRIAGLLNAQFRSEIGSPMSSLFCEAGHSFGGDTAGPAGGGGGGGGLLDPAQVARARQHVKTSSAGWPGPAKIALLDTGDAGSSNQMRDLTQPWAPRPVAATDPHGHGTAVGEAIREMAPSADIHAMQVLDASARGTSISVYLGLITALWDAAGFRLVNASLGVDANQQCGTSLAATFTYLMQLRAAAGGNPPRLVVAAGNNRSTLRAPATADGATVVKALDLNGAAAAYCSSLTIPTGISVEEGPGGTSADPLGHYANGDPIWGTSFAAGFISGAIAA